MDYGRLVLEKLQKKGFYDDIGQFDVTDEVSKFFLPLNYKKSAKKNCKTMYKIFLPRYFLFNVAGYFQMITFSSAS